MNDKINGLVKEYILWPELENDFQKNIHFGKSSMPDFQSQFRKEIYERKPIDTQIALFYLANEKLSKSRIDSQDVLGESELKDYQFYQKTLAELSKKLIAYITVCCIVEARHVNNLWEIPNEWRKFHKGNVPEDFYIDSQSAMRRVETIKRHPSGKKFLNQFFSEYRDNFTTNREFNKCIDFMVAIKTKVSDMLENNNDEDRRGYSSDNGRDSGYQDVAHNFLEYSLNNFTVEQALTYLKTIFTINHFDYDYGGKPWATIAEHGLKFTQGKMNAEMFIDQAFSLEHNNGNMFNKDFLFHSSHTFSVNFAEEGKERYETEFYLTVNNLLLNAQHNGSISGLFAIEQKMEQLESVKPSELLAELQKSGRFLEDTEETFEQKINDIKKNCQNIAPQLRGIRNHINANCPQLLEGMSNSPLDMKKIFQGIARNFEPSHPMKFLESPLNKPDGLFDLWNYLHNDFAVPVHTIEAKPFKFNLYSVDTLPVGAFDKNVIGGKAWSLANMHNLGFPVPKAKVFSTDCCSSYNQHKETFLNVLNEDLKGVKDYLQDSSGNPLLCSIRSGAPVSMPGMMDTVLNVGIDSSNYSYFCETMGQKVTDNCINKFMELFCSSRLGIQQHFNSTLDENLNKFREVLAQSDIEFSLTDRFPLKITEQIRESLCAVFSSWNSPRAKAFRAQKGISESIGTAAIVQQMVFGNLNDNSCTGVVFSRDCLTGENKLVGEFLPKAQGEDVVSGSVTPFSIDKFKSFNPTAYAELELIAKKLERTTGQIQDIEFTVESGKLYILQHRQAVCSPIAAIEILKDKSLDSRALIQQIEPKLLQKSTSVSTTESTVATGLSANSGIAQGIVVKNQEDMEIFKSQYEEKKKTNPNFGWIFYSELTSPEHMPLMNKTNAFITEQGGFTSHAAIIARSLNKPCIVGMGSTEATRFQSGQILTVDGTNGKIWQGEQPLVENTKLAKTAAKLLMKTNKITISDIDKLAFEARMRDINTDNRSWVFNLPEAHYVKTKPIKKDRFMNLGQKVAMILSANDRNVNKLKMA